MVNGCASGVFYQKWHGIPLVIRSYLKTAWFMLPRIREAMKPESNRLLGGDGGIVEADET